MPGRASRPAKPPQLPEYPARAYGPARPDRLATVARLHGLDSAPPSEARILELGCGAGVNLLSIASALPGAQCVGIDFDPQEIDRGRELADAAGLAGVELICADLREVPDRVGEADYILVHGVWSWVPDEVRIAIALFCAGRLAPGGVALVSYNALPGWYAWRPAQVLARRALARDPGADPLVAAREAVELARRLHGPSQGPYGAALAAAVERYQRLEPALLLRDDLAEVSTPFWLEDVAGRFAAAGLSYVGEAIPEHWWQWRAAGLTADRVRAAGGASALARQQFADLAAGVDFKATVFAADASPRTDPDPGAIAQLYVTATPNSAPLPPSAPPAMRELEAQLRKPQPRAPTVLELAGRCRRSEESAARGVLRLMAEGRLDLHVEPPPWALQAPERPEVHRLARAQVRSGQEVTTLRHDQVILRDPHAQALVSLMDGTRDRAALADELARSAGTSRAGAERAVQEFLVHLAALGLLRAAVG
jgi:SAM-dependent methyltransferase